MNEQDTRERACIPNGYGLCSAHPVCDYMRATVQEYQKEVAKLKTYQAMTEAHLHKLCTYLLTCQENNTDEWMRDLVERINATCDMLGDHDRFIYRDTRGNGWIDRKVLP